MSSVGNGDRVVMSVETMDQSLNRRLLEMTDVGSGLTRFLVESDCLRIDGTESIDNNLKAKNN